MVDVIGQILRLILFVRSGPGFFLLVGLNSTVDDLTRPREKKVEKPGLTAEIESQVLGDKAL